MSTAQMWASPTEWLFLCVMLSATLTAALMGYMHGRLGGMPLLLKVLPLDLAIAVLGVLGHRGFPEHSAGSAITVGLMIGGLCYYLGGHCATRGQLDAG